MRKNKKKMDGSDITFLYLVYADSLERLENLVMSVKSIQKHWNTNIAVMEVSPYCNNILKKILGKGIMYSFIKDNDPILYRTMYLNKMLRSISTPFAAVLDSDVIIPFEQVKKSIELLRNGNAKFILPYHRKFLDTSTLIRKLYVERQDVRILNKYQHKMVEMNAPRPVGGAYFCDVEEYCRLGLEDESCYGWGVEDGIRFYKWNATPYHVTEVEGVMFHLSHPRNINSNFQNEEQNAMKLRDLHLVLNKSNNEIYD